jgi:hypothetical protein
MFADRMEAGMRALTKRTRAGGAYERRRDVERILASLGALDDRSLISACRAGGDDMPSECLVHVARTAARSGSRTLFAAAYGVLERRILRRLSRRGFRSTDAAVDVEVRDAVVDRVRVLFASDAAEPGEALDFLEVSFDAAMEAFRLDAFRRASRRARGRVDLTTADGAPTAEVERAVADAAGGDAEDALLHECRMAFVRRELPRLPPLRRRIVELLMDGLPIDSASPDAPSVSRVLRRSERSVRSHRDAAFASIERAWTRRGSSACPWPSRPIAPPVRRRA